MDMEWYRAETQSERIARFNACKDVFVFRDFYEYEHTLSWVVMHGDAETFCGWTDRNFRTLREAIAFMRREYPTMPHWRVFLPRVEGNKPARRLNSEN